MLFHTWTFLLFFIVVYALYLSIKGTKGRRLLIMVSSFIFYGWWNPLYLLLISWVILGDFTAVQLMERTGRRKFFLSMSIANNMVVLGFFKYGNFIVENINEALTALGLSPALPQTDILLPVGISFYIFQSMSYTIDFYYGRIEREKSIIQYAAFVSFFPQLVAGPIERASHLLPQMKEWRRAKGEDISLGIYLFTRGMFKKTALADYFALYSDKIFGNPANYTSGDLMAGVLAFTWQIYFDFSGYTDMARGIAKMMGIDLMENFRLPYLAKNTSDFWNRWHISLSSWFRDYVYIPLGGNRKGLPREYGNILATMLLSGLWHGAAWSFLLWGLVHSLLQITSKLLKGFMNFSKVPVPIKRVFIFILVSFAWIFFRAESGSDSFIIMERIFTTTLSMPSMPLTMMILMGVCYTLEWLLEYNKVSFLLTPWGRTISMGAMIVYMLFLVNYNTNEFIYFQF